MKLMVLLSVIFAAANVLAHSSGKRASTNVWITVTVTITNGNPPKTHPPIGPPSNAKAQKPSSSSDDRVGHSENGADTSFNYAKAMLAAHNSHRGNHSAPALSWSDELANFAQQIGQTCSYAHNSKPGGGGYGQNIGAGAPPEDGPAMITNLMYNDEIDLYPGYGGEPNMDDFEKWGHFSQIVWKGTQEVGCATVHCPGGLGNTGRNVSPYFLVCNFMPSGNVQGQYRANVLEPQGRPVINL